MPKIYNLIFSCLNWKKYCLEVELACENIRFPGDEKVQNGSSVGLHAVSHSMPQQLQNVIKTFKQKGEASYWNSEHMYSIEK